MRWDYTAPEKKLFVSDGVEDLLLHPGGQAGHRHSRAAGRQGDDAGPVSRRQGQPDARLHAVAASSCPPGMPAGTRALKLVPKITAAGLRLADARRRSGDARPPGPGDRRRPGRHLDVLLHQPEGKRRVWPIRRSRSRFPAVSMSSPMRRVAESPPDAAALACALPLVLAAAPPVLRLRDGDGRPARPRRRAAPGLRPRRRRVHQGRSGCTRTTPTRVSASSAPSCARRRITSQRGRRLAATGKFDEALVEYELAAELNPTQRRHRRASCATTRNQLRAKVAVVARRQDRARDADRARARPAAARPRPAAATSRCRRR